MYTPVFNAVQDEDEIRALVASVGVANLISVAGKGFPVATLLPVVWDGDRLVMHMARANDHWRQVEPAAPGLAVVTGPNAYVSPSWYPSKPEHGRVVPTWNYSAVHLAGRLTVHDDPQWVREAVEALTAVHEHPRSDPWSIRQAPARYIDKQLNAIVGIELRIQDVQAKAKLSQNRSLADQAGVRAGLRQEDNALAQIVADQMDPERRR